jgi:hypothetical protein
MKISKQKITIIIALVTALFVPFVAIKAQEDSTSSAAQALEEESDNLEDKINQLITDRIKGKSSDLQVYSRSGKIREINGDAFLIENTDLTVQIATDAAIIRYTPGVGNADLEPEDIETEEFVIAMGFLTENNQALLAKRLVLTPSPTPPTKRTLTTGTVAEIDNREVIVNVTDTEEKTFTIPQNADLKINGTKDSEIEDIFVNDSISLIHSVTGDNQINTVLEVLVIPSDTNPEAEQETE